MKIHKPGLYWIECRYLPFPYVNMIHWIISYIDPEMMVLSSAIRTKIATFRAQDYSQMYHLLKLVITMETPFNIPKNNANSKDIFKNQVKEPTKFRMTPNQIYKMKILRKAYQYSVIFAFCLYDQESIETFPQSWVITLDQLASEGKACNQFEMLAHKLKEQVTRARQLPQGQQAEIYMSVYILNEICAHQQFLGLKWAWTLVETSVNIYCTLFSKFIFRGVITQFSDHLVILVYNMIFEKDPPCMSMETMEALIDIADWYASPFGTFICMYSMEKPHHVLPKFAMDKLVMQEKSYHTSARLSARLHRKRKAPWPTLPL